MLLIYLSDRSTREGVAGLAALRPADVRWIDLLDAYPEEVIAVEGFIGSQLMTSAEAEEIESSSRFYEDGQEIQLNSFFLQPDEEGWSARPVTIALRNDMLITRRTVKLRSFSELERRWRNMIGGTGTAHELFLMLVDIRIDLDADLIESLGREVSQLNKDLKLDGQADRALLLRIDRMLDDAMMMRENIVDKQRTLASVLKSERFPATHRPAVRSLLRDIESILEHIRFGFERLEFLQNTAMGLVSIEQNKVIKIFTVATVVFMPPTLIASVYGMNFDLMPELKWMLGYPFALGLMAVSSGATLYYFKRKGWL
jgi:magnesium transporter